MKRLAIVAAAMYMTATVGFAVEHETHAWKIASLTGRSYWSVLDIGNREFAKSFAFLHNGTDYHVWQDANGWHAVVVEVA